MTEPGCRGSSRQELPVCSRSTDSSSASAAHEEAASHGRTSMMSRPAERNVQHGLQPIDLVRRKTDECGTAVIVTKPATQPRRAPPAWGHSSICCRSDEDQQSSSTQSLRRVTRGGVGVQIDAQIPYGGGRGYEVLADPHRSLWNLILSPTRGTPEDFCLGGVELESIAMNPQCNFI